MKFINIIMQLFLELFHWIIYIIMQLFLELFNWLFPGTDRETSWKQTRHGQFFSIAVEQKYINLMGSLLASVVST